MSARRVVGYRLPYPAKRRLWAAWLRHQPADPHGRTYTSGRDRGRA